MPSLTVPILTFKRPKQVEVLNGNVKRLSETVNESLLSKAQFKTKYYLVPGFPGWEGVIKEIYAHQDINGILQLEILMLC